MSSHLTVLIGDKASTKHYTIDPITDRAQKGTVKTSYLHDSYTVPVSNLVDLWDAILTVRNDPKAFIIRGMGREPILTQVRRTKEEPDNFHEEPTQWLCFDFDELPYNSTVPIPQLLGSMDCNRMGQFINDNIIKQYLPKEFHNIACIYQWSSSAGLMYKDQVIKQGINLHLFFWLDRAVNDRELKTWLDKGDLIWDMSVFNTVTPIFVGNHIVRDPAITDYIDDSNKVGFVLNQEHVEVTVPEIEVKNVDDLLQSLEMPEDTVSDILQQLYNLGAIYKSSGSWFKLKHPGERTPGDWHIRKSDPRVVHHHAHKSKRVDRWIKDFYHVDTTFKLPVQTLDHTITKIENKKIDILADMRRPTFKQFKYKVIK
jgi:hypothetical protein